VHSSKMSTVIIIKASAVCLVDCTRNGDVLSVILNIYWVQRLQKILLSSAKHSKKHVIYCKTFLNQWRNLSIWHCSQCSLGLQIPSLHARRPTTVSYWVTYVAYVTFHRKGSPRWSIDSQSSLPPTSSII
jgi:hypothetical protein